ncbi:hypothetical protein LCGC14_2894160 [marine sediment metagenome]|uniref:Uncharacterized protein n=1 Tax=marine sediment metagenome TaxID=412755 RepID=A0A0F8YI59_9ZZZZ
MPQKRIFIQLHDHVTRKAISDAGGMVYVTVTGTPDKQALLTKTGAAAANPSLLVNGQLDFYFADTVTTNVDLYIMGPKGEFLVIKDVAPSGPNEVYLDRSRREEVAVIPFSIADMVAATEFDTGMELPADMMVHAQGAGIFVDVLEATETLDVGLLSSEAGGDANGFMSLMDVATAGAVAAKAVVTVGGTENFFASTTLGALLSEAFLAGANVATDVGTNHDTTHRCDGTAKTISLTLTAGSALAKGYVFIPYTRMAAP